MPEQTIVSKPLLYGGISKQAPHLRHPSQVDDAINVDFSPAFGAFSRAGTKFVANLGSVRMTLTGLGGTGTLVVGNTISRTSGSPAFAGVIVAVSDSGNQVTIQETSGTFTTGVGVTTSNGTTATVGTIWAQWATGTKLRLQPIARDETERYLLIQGPSGYPRIIPVGSALGKEAVLAATGSPLTYLQANSPEAKDYRYCTIRDVTYIANSKKKMSGVNWASTVAAGVEQGTVTASTMPHKISRTSLSPLTFTFAAETWESRYINASATGRGNSSNNPLPAAIGGFPYGTTIATATEGFSVSEIGVFNNRLMLVAGGYIVFSQANNFTDFWYDDPTAVVDSDPINFAMPGAYADRATALRRTIIISSKENQQYEASYAGDTFTPSTATLGITTAIRSVTGVEMPRFQTGVLIPSVSNNAGTIHYYDYDDVALSYTTRPFSAHVESLMPQSITRVVADTTTGFAAIVTEDDSENIYAMRLAYIDGRQVQNAWAKWFFANDGLTRVCDVAIIGGVLYLLTEYAGAYYVHGMHLGSPLSATTETLLTGASVSASGESMAADA
jgi:hypothetical protein